MNTATIAPTATLADLEERLAQLEERLRAPAAAGGVCLVVFSGELDRLLAAFAIATGAAACGQKVSMFFTFWGTAALKKAGPQGPGKTWVERMFGWMLPGGQRRLKLTRLHFGGLGRWMMAREMRKKRVPELPEFIRQAGALGVKIHICEMSMELMGIRGEELIDYPGLEYCGVGHFLSLAATAGTTMFI